MKNNGGPAFPSKKLVKTCTAYEETVYMEGMDLLDYFAAKAMQGILANSDNDAILYKELSRVSYEIAIAMIDEREKLKKLNKNITNP